MKGRGENIVTVSSVRGLVRPDDDWSRCNLNIGGRSRYVWIVPNTRRLRQCVVSLWSENLSSKGTRNIGSWGSKGTLWDVDSFSYLFRHRTVPSDKDSLTTLVVGTNFLRDNKLHKCY